MVIFLISVVAHAVALVDLGGDVAQLIAGHLQHHETSFASLAQVSRYFREHLLAQNLEPQVHLMRRDINMYFDVPIAYSAFRSKEWRSRASLIFFDQSEVVEFLNDPRSRYFYKLKIRFDGALDVATWGLFSRLHSLRELDLSHNIVGDAGAEGVAALVDLRFLDLSDCGVSEHGMKHLERLQHVERLVVRNNDIQDEGARSIASLKKLSHLSVEHCGIRSEGVRSLARLQQLQFLNLNDNLIEDRGVVHLLAGGLKDLKFLMLRGCHVHEVGVVAVGKLLSLTQLDLSSNDIGNDGVDFLTELKSLTSLNVSDCGLTSAYFVAALPHLHNLNISGNAIGNDGIKNIAQHLVELAYLDVDSCDITSRGLRSLVRLHHLTSLSISENAIANAGARRIAQLGGLRSLIVDDCGIDHLGAKYIARLTGLIELSMKENSIGDAGADHIAKLTGLERLTLEECGLGNDGAMHISRLSNLVSLDLSLNDIEDEGIAAIIDNYPVNLTDIVLRHCGITYETIERIHRLPTALRVTI